MRHKVADAGGPVHYLDFGGSGRPLLMVHGLGGNALNWMAVGPAIARTHRALAIDLAGFGQTPLHGRSATVGANAELLHDFIAKIVGEPVVLMGNSMGGHIAIIEAATHAEWVDAMVLVDPAIPGTHVSRPEPLMLATMAALSVAGLAQTLLDRRLRSLMLPPQHSQARLPASCSQTHLFERCQKPQSVTDRTLIPSGIRPRRATVTSRSISRSFSAMW